MLLSPDNAALVATPIRAGVGLRQAYPAQGSFIIKTASTCSRRISSNLSPVVYGRLSGSRLLPLLPPATKQPVPPVMPIGPPLYRKMATGSQPSAVAPESPTFPVATPADVDGLTAALAAPFRSRLAGSMMGTAPLAPCRGTGLVPKTVVRPAAIVPRTVRRAATRPGFAATVFTWLFTAEHAPVRSATGASVGC